MKSLFLSLSFFFLMTNISAQDNAVSKDKSWTFAAGVTAYSHNSFMKDMHPLELNFRYKIKDKHVLRLGIPILKTTKPKADMVNSWMGKINEIDIESMVYDDYENKLFGLSLGYNYEKRICEFIYLMIGADFGTFWNKTVYDSFGISYYYDSAIDNRSSIFTKTKVHRNGFVMKPFIGVRGQYKYIMAEFTLGSNYQTMKNDWNIYNRKSIDVQGDFSELEGKFGHHSNEWSFSYAISLYVTF